MILQEGALVVADPMLHGHGALHSFSALFGLHTSSRKALTAVLNLHMVPVLSSVLPEVQHACLYPDSLQVLNGP